MKAGNRCGVPCGCGGGDQANRVAGEQREVLRVQEQRGSHDVRGSSLNSCQCTVAHQSWAESTTQGPWIETE